MAASSASDRVLFFGRDGMAGSDDDNSITLSLSFEVRLAEESMWISGRFCEVGRFADVVAGTEDVVADRVVQRPSAIGDTTSLTSSSEWAVSSARW